jgi:hypothetical protein
VTPDGRAETLYWVPDKIPWFPVLVFSLKKERGENAGPLYRADSSVICRIQGLTQILSKIFFIVLKSLIFVNIQVIYTTFKIVIMLYCD